MCSNCHFGNGEEGIETKTGNNTSLILKTSIIFSVLFIIFCACSCYFKCRKISNNRGVITRINNQVNNRNIRNNNYSDYKYRNLELDANNINYNIESQSNIIITIKKVLTLEEILTNEKYLGSKKCKKEYEKYNIECTICLEKFKVDIDMVCLSPCFHLFHYKCLYDYFHANKKAKCPNCNYDIINHFQKKI